VLSTTRKNFLLRQTEPLDKRAVPTAQPERFVFDKVLDILSVVTYIIEVVLLASRIFYLPSKQIADNHLMWVFFRALVSMCMIAMSEFGLDRYASNGEEAYPAHHAVFDLLLILIWGIHPIYCSASYWTRLVGI
jgi:hypothetical protein